MRAGLIVVPVAALVAGCTGGAPADGLPCAATIAAADQLMNTGKAPRDPTVNDEGVLALATHVNVWAIPKRLPEKEAYATVLAERDRLVAGSTPPAQVMQQARQCVTRAQAMLKRMG
ncbi:MAG TPA: hypothetical protein VF699_03215 [Caulobacteraceae bacterium]|jgi:hypothetical protein